MFFFEALAKSFTLFALLAILIVSVQCSGKVLRDGVINTNKLSITTARCSSTHITFISNGSLYSLRQGKLITGTFRGTCGTFYRKITSVRSVCKSTIVQTVNVPYASIYRDKYAYEECNSISYNINNSCANAATKKTNILNQLTQLSRRATNAKCTSAQQLINSKRTAINNSYSSMSSLCSHYKRVMNAKLRTSSPACSLATLNARYNALTNTCNLQTITSKITAKEKEIKEMQTMKTQTRTCLSTIKQKFNSIDTKLKTLKAKDASSYNYYHSQRSAYANSYMNLKKSSPSTYLSIKRDKDNAFSIKSKVSQLLSNITAKLQAIRVAEEKAKIKQLNTEITKTMTIIKNNLNTINSNVNTIKSKHGSDYLSISNARKRYADSYSKLAKVHPATLAQYNSKKSSVTTLNKNVLTLLTKSGQSVLAANANAGAVTLLINGYKEEMKKAFASTDASFAAIKKGLPSVKAKAKSVYADLNKRYTNLQSTYASLKKEKMISVNEYKNVKTKVNTLSKNAESLAKSVGSATSLISTSTTEKNARLAEVKKMESTITTELKRLKPLSVTMYNTFLKQLNTIKSTRLALAKSKPTSISGFESDKTKSSSLRTKATNLVKSVQQSITTITKKKTEVNSALTLANSKVLSINKKLSSFKKKTATSYKNLQKRLTTLKGTLNKLKKENPKTTSEWQSLKNRVASLTKDLNSFATQVSNAFEKDYINTSACITAPRVKVVNDPNKVSYTTKLISFDPTGSYTVYVFDKHKSSIKHLCCTGTDRIKIFWNGAEDSTIVKHSAGTLYLTGGPEWGCKGKAIYRKFVKLIENNAGYSVIQTASASESQMFHTKTGDEKQREYYSSIEPVYKKIENLFSSIKDVMSDIKSKKKSIDSVGSSSDKKSAQSVYDKAEKVYTSADTTKASAKSIKNSITYKASDVTKIEANRKTLNSYLTTIRDYKTKIYKISNGVAISSKNFYTQAKTLFNDIMKFTSDKAYIEAMNTYPESAMYATAKSFKQTIDGYVEKAKKTYNKDQTTNAIAQASYDTLTKIKKDGKAAIASYSKKSNTSKTDVSKAKELLKEVKTILDSCKKKLKPYSSKSFLFAKIGNDLMPEHVKTYDKLNKEYSDFFTDLDKNTKTKISKSIPALKTKCTKFEKDVDVSVKIAKNYQTYLDKTRSNINSARTFNSELMRKDKQKGEAVAKKIEEAEQKKDAAVKLYNKAKLLSAEKEIIQAKSLSEAALKASKQKIDTSKYVTATTTTSKERSELIYTEISKLYNDAKPILNELKEFDSSKYKSHDKKLEKYFANAGKCKKDASNPKTNSAATKAIKCMQTAKSNVSKEKTAISKSLSSAKSKRQIAPVNGILTIPQAKVKTISCSSNSISITFKEAVYIKLSKGMTIKGSSGCYDSATKKKGPYSRVVEEVKTLSSTDLKVTTKIVSVPTPVNKDQSGFSFSKEPTGVFKKGMILTAVLQVTNKSYLGKQATVKVVSATNGAAVSQFKKYVVLSKTTAISLKISSSTTVNSGFLTVSFGNKVLATTKKTFSLNPSFKFLTPNKKNERYHFDEYLKVSYQNSAITSQNEKCLLSFLKYPGSQVVHKADTYGFSASYFIKNLPSKVKTGTYTLSLNCNNEVITSVPIYIDRSTKFTKIEFTSPKPGETFKKGDTIPITWTFKNDYKVEKFSLYLSSEDSTLRTRFVNYFKGPIASNVKISAKNTTGKLAARLHPTSTFLLPAGRMVKRQNRSYLL